MKPHPEHDVLPYRSCGGSDGIVDEWRSARAVSNAWRSSDEETASTKRK